MSDYQDHFKEKASNSLLEALGHNPLQFEQTLKKFLKTRDIVEAELIT